MLYDNKCVGGTDVPRSKTDCFNLDRFVCALFVLRVSALSQTVLSVWRLHGVGLPRTSVSAVMVAPDNLPLAANPLIEDIFDRFQREASVADTL